MTRTQHVLRALLPAFAYLLLGSALIQASEAANDAQATTANVTEVFPTNPGSAIAATATPVKAEPRLLSVPKPNAVVPHDTDAIQTPAPSRTPKLLKTAVPGVRPASHPGRGPPSLNPR